MATVRLLPADLEDLAVAERDLDHAIRGLLAIVAVDVVLLAHGLVDLFGQRPCVDADAKRDLSFLRRLDHLGQRGAE